MGTRGAPSLPAEDESGSAGYLRQGAIPFKATRPLATHGGDSHSTSGRIFSSAR